VYSAALLIALQTVCQVELPICYIEAAELDEDNLKAFLEALSKECSDYKGNILVAHYFKDVFVEGVNIIDMTEDDE
jgi:hypothetical protein